MFNRIKNFGAVSGWRQGIQWRPFKILISQTSSDESQIHSGKRTVDSSFHSSILPFPLIPAQFTANAFNGFPFCLSSLSNWQQRPSHPVWILWKQTQPFKKLHTKYTSGILIFPLKVWLQPETQQLSAETVSTAEAQLLPAILWLTLTSLGVMPDMEFAERILLLLCSLLQRACVCVCTQTPEGKYCPSKASLSGRPQQ